MDLLTPEERELLSCRYLQETPLSHRQIQRRMGLTKAEQLAMEEAALERLRSAALEMEVKDRHLRCICRAAGVNL